MERPGYFQGQRLIYSSCAIVHFLEWRYHPAGDRVRVRDIKGVEMDVSPQNLKPLPGGQL